MTKTLITANQLVVFLSLFLSGVFLAQPVFAGTLSCTVRTSTCSGGEVEIFELNKLTNSHAGLPAASYTNLVCCTGVTGLSNNCSGTFATALKLSGTTNAHVRRGTGLDYPSATNACISVPGGGSVVVAYQATNCTGYDTLLGTMIGTTNSHVGDSSWTAGTTKICASAVGSGALSVDIVDGSGVTVGSPSVPMNSATFSFSYQTITGIFGVSTEKIRVDNSTLNPQWTLDLAASSGPTAKWHSAAMSVDYDFNDPTASAVDGVDADSFGGQMTVDPSVGTITPKGGCSNTGLSLGSSSAFSEGSVDNINLMTAGATASTGCYWDLTGVGISQTVPKEQPAASDYNMNMTLTVTAI